MRRCNDIYEIVTVYYPTGCVNTTRTTTSTSTTLAPTTTTTTTIAIPPGAVPIPIVVGYQTISPPENIVLSPSLEDICNALTNSSSGNVVPGSEVIDDTTYYFDFDTFMMYNSVTNTFAEDGYYISVGFFYVTNGLAVIVDVEEILALCQGDTTTTTTSSSTSSTTTTTTTSNYNSYNYQGQYYDCDTCVNIGGLSLANIEPLTVGKWYNYTNSITNISRKVQIVTYLGPSLSSPNTIILDSTKQDTCGELPPCPTTTTTSSSTSTTTSTTLPPTTTTTSSTTAIPITTTTTSSSTSTSTSTTTTTLDPNLIPIGTQIWTTRNLEVTTYRNGDVIPQVTDPTAWGALTTGAWCYYNNDPANGAIYGKLYNWFAVNDPRGLAPVGYHIPLSSEWTTLTTYLGGDIGGKMKTTGTSQWLPPNTGATNSSGFSGLPGGYRTSDGTSYGIGETVYWWTFSQINTINALTRFLVYYTSSVGSTNYDKKGGFSVRLIKD